MSHFAVMVIGDAIDEQLERYSENNKVEEYSRGEVTEGDKQRMLDYYKENKGLNYKSFEGCYLVHGREWNGNNWRKDEDGVWREYSTYNPDSKWDRYSVGGRWSGAFITHLKPEAKDILSERNYGKCYDGNAGIDSIEKKYIDFDAIRKKEEDRAREKYRSICACFPDNTIPKIEHTFEEVKKMFEKDGDVDIDKARDFYNAQESIILWNKAREKMRTGFFDSLENYQISEEEYVKRAGDNAFVPFAVVKDYEWYEKGNMGWWGISTNDKEETEWQDIVKKLLDETDDDEMITIVDCHI